MQSKIDKVRLYIFKVWFVTLFVILAAFAMKFSGLQGISPAFSSAFQSLQMMVGLVVPQIGVMAAFYFNLDKQKEKIDALTEGQMVVITWLSVSYHLIFVVTVLAGIVFYRFDATADGKSLERNTAAVVAIMGLFSLFLTPVAFLFASPKKNEP